MVKQVLQLIFGHFYPQLISGIDHKNNGLGFVIVLLPELAILALTAHVKNGKVYFALGKCLHLEAHRSRDVHFRILFGKVVKKALLSWV